VWGARPSAVGGWGEDEGPRQWTCRTRRQLQLYVQVRRCAVHHAVTRRCCCCCCYCCCCCCWRDVRPLPWHAAPRVLQPLAPTALFLLPRLLPRLLPLRPGAVCAAGCAGARCCLARPAGTRGHR
jgi:hypothetical protein